MTYQPTVVLTHGAFTDGSCWNDVIEILQKRRYTVLAVQNPLTSLAEDVAATLRTMQRTEGPIVLVGHSWGGAVITQAGLTPRVSALVYLSALAPDAGEQVTTLQQHGPAAQGMEAAEPDRAGFLWLPAAHYGAALAADVPPGRIRLMAATQQPIALRCFSDPVTGAAWRQTPSHYLVTEADQALSPVLQRWMAQRMGAAITSVQSSHMSMISHPRVVADVIESAAHATPPAGDGISP